MRAVMYAASVPAHRDDANGEKAEVSFRRLLYSADSKLRGVYRRVSNPAGGTLSRVRNDRCNIVGVGRGQAGRSGNQMGRSPGETAIEPTSPGLQPSF